MVTFTFAANSDVLIIISAGVGPILSQFSRQLTWILKTQTSRARSKSRPKSLILRWLDRQTSWHLMNISLHHFAIFWNANSSRISRSAPKPEQTSVQGSYPNNPIPFRPGLLDTSAYLDESVDRILLTVWLRLLSPIRGHLHNFSYTTCVFLMTKPLHFPHFFVKINYMNR